MALRAKRPLAGNPIARTLRPHAPVVLLPVHQIEDFVSKGMSTMRTHIASVAAVIAAAAWLVACGGGGGGGSSTSATPIVVALGAPSVSASGTPSGGAQSAFVNVTVTGETGTLYVGAETTHQAVETARVTGANLDSLQVEVDFRESGTLPDGSYTDTVTVYVCKDQACNQPVAGSPLTLPVSLAVSGSGAAAVPNQGATPTAYLAHDVVDAALSKSLSAIVMASAQPSNAVYVYDIATGHEKSIALGKAPTSIALSPDGRKLAVGHDAMVSYIDLTNYASATPTVREAAVPTTVWDLVLDANNFVQAFPASDQWVNLYTLDMSTGNAIQQTSVQVYEKTRARLHPAGDRMYTLDTHLSPENVQRFSVTNGVPAYVGAAPYWGDWAMCGNLWFSESGDRMYTACGNTFTSNVDITQDMLHLGSVPVTDQGSYSPNIVWLDESSSAGEAAYLDAGHCGGDGGPDCDTLLRISNTSNGALRGAWWLPPVLSGGDYRVQHGLYVFHAADDSLWLVGRLAGVTDPTQAYYVDSPLAGNTHPALEHATRRAATR